MQLAQRLPFRLEARPKHRLEPVQASISPTASARRGTESMDLGYYHCGCGFAFKAEVTTTVGCPHCGTSQAW